MSMSFAALQYQNTRVTTASPVAIVVSLYDGAIRFLREAITRHEQGDVAKRGVALSKAHAIVSELTISLDHERAPEMSAQLASLYDFVLKCITDATAKADPAPLEGAIRVLTSLRSAWSELAARGT